MNEKAEVTRIVITIAGKEVSCTPEQIKDLKEALDAMYPAPKQVVHEYIYDWYRRRPVPFWANPFIQAWSGSSGVSLCAK